MVRCGVNSLGSAENSSANSALSMFAANRANSSPKNPTHKIFACLSPGNTPRPLAFMVQRGKGASASCRAAPMASTWFAVDVAQELEGQVKVRRRDPTDGRQFGFQLGDCRGDAGDCRRRDFHGDKCADHDLLLTKAVGAASSTPLGRCLARSVRDRSGP